jgi:DNA-binding NarL/FixJ family response regulator
MIAQKTRHSIVIIDDHPDLVALYESAFRNQALDIVGTAHDGAAGVSIVIEERPDLVLLDLSMPTMDGLEALIEIRREAPTTRVVVLSGFAKEGMAETVQELGASRYIEKGVLPSELVQILEEVATTDPVPYAEPSQALLARAAQLI